MRAPKHPQVTFKNFRGREVNVDEGLFYLLVLLRDNGVKTHFSCQGGRFSAYVNGSARSFNPLLKKMARLYRAGKLSKESSAFVSQLLYGYHERRFIFIYGPYEKRILVQNGIDPEIGRFAIERQYDNHWGSRITLRWPSEKTEQFENLLRELN